MKFQDEDSYRELKQVFKKNPYFWFLTAPIIVLPLRLAYIWLYLVKIVQRFKILLQKRTDRPETKKLTKLRLTDK